MTVEIKDLLLSVTNFCLGSCVYCNLKILNRFNYDGETTVKHIERLMRDPLLNNLKNIHITGGEPILTPKTYEVFELIQDHHPDVRVNMPVSGFFPYATERYLRRLWVLTPQLRVDVSLDGPKHIHELTRGKGTYRQVMTTIKLLRKIAPENKLQLQLTVMKSNHKWVEWTYNYAKRLGLGFYITFPHFGVRFGHSKNESYKHDKEFIDSLDVQLKNTWLKDRPLNRRIWAEQKAGWEGKEVRFDCDMGRFSIDVDPLGNVYPCMVYVKLHCLGNIQCDSLTDMLKKPWINKIYGGIKTGNCQPCVMPCCAWKRNLSIDGVVCVE